MASQIQLGDIAIDVVLKDIKRVHLSVHPPAGRVRISAPKRMSIETLRAFAISKLDWIRRQQRKLREQDRESQREYLDRENHYVWGRRVVLELVKVNSGPSVQLCRSRLLVRVRPGTDEANREAVVASWYRQLLKEAVPPLIEAWERRLKVNVSGFYVRQMKTKWGSCNPTARTIRLNTELAKKPKECLDYIVLHEVAHILEPTHGPGFMALMDRFMPAWGETQKLLNRLPVAHADWAS